MEIIEPILKTDDKFIITEPINQGEFDQGDKLSELDDEFSTEDSEGEDDQADEDKKQISFEPFVP